MVTLWRAAPSRTEHLSLTSWTSNCEHVRECVDGRYARRFGGPVLYRVGVDAIDATVPDLRGDPAGGTEELGLDLNDYEHEPMHDLVRNLTFVFKSYGFRRVTSIDQDLPDGCEWDEFLYLGDEPIRAQRVEPSMVPSHRCIQPGGRAKPGRQEVGAVPVSCRMTSDERSV